MSRYVGATACAYLAGPMRQVPWFNFDAFYAAEEEVAALLGDERFTDSGEVYGPGVIYGGAGLYIFNPARYDHDVHGFDVNPESGDLDDIPKHLKFDLRKTLGRDLKWIAKYATHIYMLDGWENSSGARAEKALAEALGLTVLYQTNPFLLAPEAVVASAGRPIGWTKATDSDWDEFWEDTSGVDTEAPIDYEQVVVGALSMDNLFGPYAKAVRKAETYRFSQGEQRTVSSTGGEKGMKQAQLGAIDPQSLLRLAEVAGFGARKYARLNYMNGFDWSLAFDAAQRHLLEFWNGTDRDPESGLPHLAHAAWQCLALLTFMERGLGADDRYSSTV